MSIFVFELFGSLSILLLHFNSPRSVSNCRAKKNFRKNIATEILMTNWGCNHSKWIKVDAMHVKLPAWVIPVQWEKWNYTFKECQRRFNFDRNRNKPLLLAVVWDFEVLKFWKWIWIQSMELDKLQGNPWVVKISRGHFLCW